MKITKRQLKRIIKEEKAKLIKESFSREAAINFHRGEMDFGEEDHSLMDLDDHNRLGMEINKVIGLFTKMGYNQEDVVQAISELLGDF